MSLSLLCFSYAYLLDDLECLPNVLQPYLNFCADFHLIICFPIPLPMRKEKYQTRHPPSSIKNSRQEEMAIIEFVYCSSIVLFLFFFTLQEMAVNSHMALPKRFFAHTVFKDSRQHKASTQHTLPDANCPRCPDTTTNSPLLSNYISLQRLQNN